MMQEIPCDVCFRHCLLKEGGKGFCKARGNRDGKNVSLNYGLSTGLSLDPIEKKPLLSFYPGSLILSYGSYGCNLTCPFCQNSFISQVDLEKESEKVTPVQLAELALSLKERGNIGLAFTYNEPLISYEFIKDAAREVKIRGMKNVLVTNGEASLRVLEEIAPYIDAMNIDLKSFTDEYFHYIGGDRRMVLDFIKASYQKGIHIELTTLVVPTHNDDEEDFEKEVEWIASLDKNIPLHISRYFPRYKEKEDPTPIKTLKRFEEIAKAHLTYVYLGNVSLSC